MRQEKTDSERPETGSDRQIPSFGTISRKNCEFFTVTTPQPDILRFRN